MNRKILFNKWHVIIMILGLIIWTYYAGIDCSRFCATFGKTCIQPTFSECFSTFLSDIIILPLFWLYTIIYLLILYLIITFISWLYYKNKQLMNKK